MVRLSQKYRLTITFWSFFVATQVDVLLCFVPTSFGLDGYKEVVMKVIKHILFYTKNLILSFRALRQDSAAPRKTEITDAMFVTHMHAKIHELDRLLSDHESCAITTCNISTTQSQNQAYRRKFLEDWETSYLLKHRSIPSNSSFNMQSRACMILGIPQEKLLHERLHPVIFLRNGNVVELLNS